MTLYGMVTTLATLGFPFAVRTGFAAVFVMRVLQVLLPGGKSIIDWFLDLVSGHSNSTLIPSYWPNPIAVVNDKGDRHLHRHTILSCAGIGNFRGPGPLARATPQDR